jgi:hypothetical protein
LEAIHGDKRGRGGSADGALRRDDRSRDRSRKSRSRERADGGRAAHGEPHMDAFAKLFVKTEDVEEPEVIEVSLALETLVPNAAPLDTIMVDKKMHVYLKECCGVGDGNARGVIEAFDSHAQASTNTTTLMEWWRQVMQAKHRQAWHAKLRAFGLNASVVGDVSEPKQILIAVIGMLVRNGKLRVVPGTQQIPLVVAGPAVPNWK